MTHVRMSLLRGLYVFCVQVALADSQSELLEEYHGLTLSQVTTQLERCVSEQKLVTHLSMETVGKEIRFDLSVSDNPQQSGWLFQMNLSKAAFGKMNREYESAGYELAVSDSTRLGKKRYYSGIWVRSQHAVTPLVLPDLPIPVSGQSSDQFVAVDTLMTGFLKQHNVAGATVAIGYEGELLYSRGFGWADVETQTPMLPDAVMRIASLSKPVTAVATMQLVEQGRLKLDAEVMPLLRKAGFQSPVDDRWNQITVRQLLQHTGGWDRDRTQDPTFLSGVAHKALKLKKRPRPRDMVEWQLQRPLDFAPGSQHAYSNLGYCVLGRVLEAVTGQSYNAFVTEQIVRPAQMGATSLGKTRLEDRQANEVRYHMQNSEHATAIWSVMAERRGHLQPQEVERPYGTWSLEVMDAHGGWVATAPDLIRFVSAVFDREPPLLNPATREMMLKRPAHANESDRYGTVVAGRSGRLEAESRMSGTMERSMVAPVFWYADGMATAGLGCAVQYGSISKW
jgi:CubicO group peptidase (beta-lactamase class C family)